MVHPDPMFKESGPIERARPKVSHRYQKANERR